MKREEIEKILTEELGTMYPIEKHIAIIDRLLSLSPVQGYVEVRCEDELPKQSGLYHTAAGRQEFSVELGGLWTSYHHLIMKKWWLKPVTFPDTQEEAKERYERAASFLNTTKETMKLIGSKGMSYENFAKVINEALRIAAGIKEEV